MIVHRLDERKLIHDKGRTLSSPQLPDLLWDLKPSWEKRLEREADQ
jgi:hypothetical protein